VNKEILVSSNARRCLALSAITLACLNLAGCFSEEIDARQTHEIQGLLYKIHAEDPFTGRVLNYPISVLGLFNVGTCAADFKKGLPDGEMRCSDNAGTLIASGEFKAGKRDGKEEKFDAKTGKKTAVGHWKNGLQDGVQEQFNPQNGERVLEVHYSAGKKQGRERAWDNQGDQLIAELEWDNGLQSGFDNRGTQHRTYLDGKQHGPQKEYSIDGSRFYVAREENYDNGVMHGVQKRIDARGNVTELSVFEHDKLRTRTVDEYNYSGQHVHHVSRVALKEDVNRFIASDLSNDGEEQYWDDQGNLIRQLQWRNGQLLSATATVWVGGRQESQFQGIGRDSYEPTQQDVLKHGQERLFSDNGELQAVIFWNAGSVNQILVSLPPDQRNQYPGKMGLFDGNEFWGSPVQADPDFSKPSRYNAGFATRYEQLVDIPAPGQPMQASNVPASAQAAAAPVAAAGNDQDSCVQRKVDAVHAEDPDALIRADMLEEFEQDCL
jgi:antitoxin component YwqK of YwqJK toxin-antitoxin module